MNYLQETKEQIKNAIIEKGIEITEADTFRSYASKINSINSGIDINAIIEAYQAKGVVDAGDFVKFIHKYKAGSGEVSEDTVLINNTTSFDVVELSGNRVFIVYIEKINTKYFLRAVTCTIEGNTITLDNNMLNIGYVAYTSKTTTIKLTENKVVIICNDGYQNDYRICTIIDNIITSYDVTNRSVEQTAKKYITISENQFVMLYGDTASSHRLAGVICTVDENNKISFGTTTTLNVQYTARGLSAIKATEDKILVTSNTNIDSHTNSISIIQCMINDNILSFRKPNTNCNYSK